MGRKISSRVLWFRVLTVIYLAMIYIISDHSSLPGGIRLPYGSDKLIHFIEYFIAGVLLAESFSGKYGRNQFLTAAVTGILYAASDEFHQSFVPGREMSIADLAADAAGAVSGTITWMKLKISENYFSSTLQKFFSGH